MLTSILSELNGTSEAIVASSVLSKDGLALASVFPETPRSTFNEDHIVAMSSAFMALGHKAVADLAVDELDRVLVAGKAASILMTQAGPEAILTVVFKPEAETGAIFSHMRRAATDIEALVSTCLS